MAPENFRPYAYRLPELLNVVRDRRGLAGRGGPHGPLRPLQNHLVREWLTSRCPKWQPPRTRTHSPGSFGLTNERSSEAPYLPPEATKHDAAAVQDEAPPAAEMPVAFDAPSLVPSIESPAHPDAAADSDEIENFAARRKRLQARRKQARRSSRWTALILVLFAFNVALIGARSEVVRFFPQTASLFAAVGLPVNLRNLKFENMRISKEVQEGLSSLVVEGTIVSVSNRPSEVPRLRFAARDSAGQEVYTWTAMPGRSILGPGEKLDFRSRFVSPPDNAVDVMVRFVNAQDATPAAK